MANCQWPPQQKPNVHHSRGHLATARKADWLPSTVDWGRGFTSSLVRVRQTAVGYDTVHPHSSPESYSTCRSDVLSTRSRSQQHYYSPRSHSTQFYPNRALFFQQRIPLKAPNSASAHALNRLTDMRHLKRQHFQIRGREPYLQGEFCGVQ